ncbi:Spore germination protein B3 precursor [Paenibacillus konkukensis]|uniref:Spore germination protein B3 n=2 Tax=Paenibacillus konkukensis TaxID=2020716 RepID=A0ABY4RIM2_9BACL|nr:Spore germination protein B3 precursor [Paenibacillus konkukensis]
MKRRSLLMLLLLAVVVTGGCGDVKQINRITFVTVLGIESAEKGVRVHALSAIPSRYASLAPSGGTLTGKGSPNFIMTAEGYTISDALYQLKRKSARDIQYGHTKVILFSGELAKKGLSEQLDFLMRRDEIQKIAWVAVTKGSPEHIIRAKASVPESVGDWMVDVFSGAGSDTFEVLPIYLYQFYSGTLDPGASPYSMVLSRSGEETALQTSEMALFGSDRLVGYIPSNDVKYVSLLQKRKLASTTFTLEKEKLSFTLLNYKSQVQWKRDRMNVELLLKLDLDQTARLSIDSRAELLEIESKLSRQVEKELSSLIAKLQDMRSDPVGFGEVYRVAHGGKLDKKEWLTSIFPDQRVEVHVKTNIQRKGMIK